LVSTISDKVTPSEYGYKKIKGSLHGSPVESTRTKDGKYVWASNYFMSGEGFINPGCDTCFGKNYDSSFVYKIKIHLLRRWYLIQHPKGAKIQTLSVVRLPSSPPVLDTLHTFLSSLHPSLLYLQNILLPKNDFSSMASSFKSG
jgi:hypothetical protein